MEKRVTIFGIIIGLLVLGVFGWGFFDARTKAQHAQDLALQLQGRLSETERAFVQADLTLGFVKSRLAHQTEVEVRYLALLDQKDAEMKKFTQAVVDFQRTHKAHVDSLLRANLRLQDIITKGSGTATVTPPPDGTPDAPAIISYDYKDGLGRFHLTDPDIMLPGNETLALDQHFRLTAVVLRQDEGNLKAQQLVLQEVVREGEGWSSVGVAKVIEAEFTYAPDPDRVADTSWFDPHLIFTVGSTFRREAPLNLGVGATLLRYQDFGLAANLYTDMETLIGSGLGGQITWRPRLNDRPFNLGLAAGAGLGADLSVRPYLGAFFVLY